MPSDDVIEAVERAVRNGAEETGGESSEAHRLEEGGEAFPLAREHPVSMGKAPARQALACRKLLDERRRVRVAQGKEREGPVPVDDGDDPRRPAAEASTGVVQQYRPAQPIHHSAPAKR
jgi:hypothetical protein